MRLTRPTSNENLLQAVNQMANELERLLNGNLSGENILDGSIFDADIAAAAAIARSKLNFGSGLVDADIAAAAAIARSKLNFGAGLVDADIAAGAGIAYAKLALAASIVNADIAAGAAIALSKLAAPAYTAYTPAWTSTGTAPALGNGTLTGRYNQIGKQVQAHIVLTPGSTTTFGTGNWVLSLPVTAVSNQYHGIAKAVDTSAGATYGLFVPGNTTTTVALLTPAVPGGFVGPTVPFTWATTDLLIIDYLYEAA